MGAVEVEGRVRGGCGGGKGRVRMMRADLCRCKLDEQRWHCVKLHSPHLCRNLG